MHNPKFERRLQQRHEQQQQPQQCGLIQQGTAGRGRVVRISPRQDWQSLADSQAAKQSGQL